MKAKKSILAVLLAASLASSSMFSFAATFTDMKDSKGADHWSTAYVNDISGKGLVSGYADGSFKPNNPVTRIEAIVFISRLYPQDTVKSVYESNKSKWDAKLTENLIPEFAKAPVVFGLEKKLYTEAYLKEFMNKTSKTQKDAQRYEFVVYLVRALGWQGDLSNAAVVNYTDVSAIPKQAVPYVELLGKKGVIATEGAFNPLKSVTRGEVAKMISITYPSSERAKGGTGTTTPGTSTNDKVVMPSGTVVEGKIKSISSDGTDIIITITKDNGAIAAYTNQKAGVVISLEGKSATVSDLKEGLSVKLYTDGITLKGVEAIEVNTNVNKTMSGEIVSVDRNSVKIKKGSTAETYDFASNVTVVKNGKSSRVGELVSGDDIQAKIENSLVVSVEADTVKRTIKNITVKEITSYANSTANLVVEDEQGNQYTLEFNANSQAFMNNKTVSMTTIAVGYEADVYTSSNEILDIILYGRGKGTVLEGTITEVNTRDDYFYIKDANNKEIRVNVARDTEIVQWPSSGKKYIDDLEKGYRVILNGFAGGSVFDATNVAYYK